LDPAATLDAYGQDRREQTFINPVTLIWDYLIYTCTICGRRYKYTYKDVERRVREYFSSLSKEYKDHFEEMISRAEENYDTNGEGRQEPVGTMVANQKLEVAERVRRLYMKK